MNPPDHSPDRPSPTTPAAQAARLKAIEAALALHRAGKHELAMQRYVAILADEPTNADVLYYCAVLAVQEGQAAEGIRIVQRALSVGPPQARLHNLMGQAQLRLKQPNDALLAFERAIVCDPGFADAHGNRANVLADMGRRAEALQAFDQALALRPDNAEDLYNRATVLAELGRLPEALAGYDRAIGLRPDFAQAHYGRANLLRDAGQIEEALAGYQRAAQLSPEHAEFHGNLALALKDLGRLDEALAAVDRALTLAPNSIETMLNRGQILRKLERLDDAEAQYARVLKINSNRAAAHLGRANLLLDRGRFVESRAAAELACRLDPAAPEAPNTLAYLQLLHGDWEEGWKNYESRGRTRLPAYNSLPYTRWHGEPLVDERLVVMTEQGMGDAIHFCRFAPILAELGFDVTILTDPPLARLLSTLRGVRIATSTAELDQESRPIRWVPLMSVPGILGIKPTAIPAKVPYLSAEPDRVAAWADRLGADGFKIGICWKSGNPRDRITRHRDIPFETYAPLAEIPGVRLIGLQLGPGVRQIGQVSFHHRIEDMSQSLRDWADTAALMMNLDVVVTCDTSVPHLAGALARSTFVALPSIACWRWQLDRDDSPWYPTMRLFRQTTNGDWSDVFARIALAVADMSKR